MTTGRLLLVDYSNLFYRGSNAHADLSWKGNYTGGIYGFVNGLAHLVRQTQPTRVAVCVDVKPYARTLDFPEYKQGRTFNDDEERLAALTRNRQVVNEFLNLVRCPAIGAEGFEADDVMAVLARRHEYDYAEIVLASNDNDLYQLLGQSNLSVYRGGKLGYYDSRKFFYDNPTLTNCQQWSEVTALAGGHNATPGIKGVGVKTAIKIVTDPVARQKHEEVLKDFRRQFRANKHLCRVPYPPLEDRFDEVALPEPLFGREQWGKYDERAVIRQLAVHGINFTGMMSQAFDTVARGNGAI